MNEYRDFLDRLEELCDLEWYLTSDGRIRVLIGWRLLCPLTAIAHHEYGGGFGLGDQAKAGEMYGYSEEMTRKIVESADGITLDGLREKILRAVDLVG